MSSPRSARPRSSGSDISSWKKLQNSSTIFCGTGIGERATASFST